MARTKVVAYANDLLIATRGDSIRAVENYANVEMRKINECSRRNKIKFNDKKSKAMLVTRRKKSRGQGHHNLLAFQTFKTSYTDEIFRNNFGPEI